MCLALGIRVFFPSALITPLYWVKMLRITVLEKDARVHTAKTVAGFGPGALDPKAFLLSHGAMIIHRGHIHPWCVRANDSWV